MGGWLPDSPPLHPLTRSFPVVGRETGENRNEFRRALTLARVLHISICFKGFQSININENKEDTKTIWKKVLTVRIIKSWKNTESGWPMRQWLHLTRRSFGRVPPYIRPPACGRLLLWIIISNIEQKKNQLESPMWYWILKSGLGNDNALVRCLGAWESDAVHPILRRCVNFILEKFIVSAPAFFTDMMSLTLVLLLVLVIY